VVVAVVVVVVAVVVAVAVVEEQLAIPRRHPLRPLHPRIIIITTTTTTPTHFASMPT
jgi:hypothetical protein